MTFLFLQLDLCRLQLMGVQCSRYLSCFTYTDNWFKLHHQGNVLDLRYSSKKYSAFMRLTAKKSNYFLSLAAIIQNWLCWNLNQITANIVISKFISQGLVYCVLAGLDLMSSFFFFFFLCLWFLCKASVSYIDKWGRIYEWEQGSSGELMHIHKFCFSTKKVYEGVTFLAPHTVEKLII